MKKASKTTKASAAKSKAKKSASKPKKATKTKKKVAAKPKATKAKTTKKATSKKKTGMGKKSPNSGKGAGYYETVRVEAREAVAPRKAYTYKRWVSAKAQKARQKFVKEYVQD